MVNYELTFEAFKIFPTPIENGANMSPELDKALLTDGATVVRGLFDEAPMARTTVSSAQIALHTHTI